MMKPLAYFLVEPSSSASLPRIGGYRGIDRHPWKCADDAYYSGRLTDREIGSLLKARENFVGNLSFGTFDNIEAAMLLAKSCEPSEKVAILEVECLGRVDDLDPVSCNVNFDGNGIDLYLDGYGSPILLGAFSKPDLFQENIDRLNKFGLFETVVDINNYLIAYARVELVADIEPLSGMGAVWAYRVRREMHTY